MSVWLPVNSAALPTNCACTWVGILSSSRAFSIAATACDNECPGARLNEMVTAGSCCWWLTTNGVLVTLASASAASGMMLPAPTTMPVFCAPTPVAVDELDEVTWPKLVALVPVSAPLPLLATASWFIKAVLVRNSGATSSTTRY